MAVAESYLRSSSDDGRPPVEIVVHVEADSLANPASSEPGTLEDGSSISPATVQRLACDAQVVMVVENARGTPLDIGRRRRTIPTALRRALRYRDRGCRFPGRGNRIVEGHHVVPWSHGGETRLANLCSLCRTHHPQCDGTPPDYRAASLSLAAIVRDGAPSGRATDQKSREDGRSQLRVAAPERTPRASTSL
jgi:hypothetical protein